MLQHLAGDLGSGADREFPQFFQGFVGAELWRTRRFRSAASKSGAIARSLRASGQRTFGIRPPRARSVIDANQKSSFNSGPARLRVLVAATVVPKRA